MRIKVQAGGLLQGVSDIIKGLSGLVDKVFKNLDDGTNSKDVVNVDTKSKRTVSLDKVQGIEMDLIVFDEKIGTVTIVPQDNELYTLQFKAKGHATETIKDVKEADMDKTKADWSMKYFAKRQTKASESLKVTLKRVTSGKYTEIHLTAISGSTDVNASANAINTILADNSFSDIITEDPQSFEIVDVPDEDSYDVKPCDSFDGSGGLEVILSNALSLYMNFQMMHWNAKGNNFTTVHRMFEDWYYKLKWDIDIIGELYVEIIGNAPNPGSLIDTSLLIPSNSEYTEEESYQIAYDAIGTYCVALELYYVNFAHDVQSELDDMIRYWRKEHSYKLARILQY